MSIVWAVFQSLVFSVSRKTVAGQFPILFQYFLTPLFSHLSTITYYSVIHYNVKWMHVNFVLFA